MLCKPNCREILVSQDLMFKAYLSNDTVWIYKYSLNKGLLSYTVFNGQLELYLSEIEFNKYFKKIEDK